MYEKLETKNVEADVMGRYCCTILIHELETTRFFVPLAITSTSKTKS